MWDADAFGYDDRYKHTEEGAIDQPTILVVDAETGAVRSHFGSDT